jgi:tryptophanyl-tRNA synthetase
MKKTLFSGIQPSGELHIGNYLGALKQWVELQNSNDFQPLFCVVDLHSLTQDYDPQKKQEQILNTAVDFLACGVDPKKAILFVQSQVPEHAELAWLFNCLTPVAELERMTQYKDKSARQKENINMGLFDYPVLMAADILLYKTEIVPVGEDQIQHVELARVIARKFNNKFGEFFPEPKTKLVEARRIMALSEPDKKMSKSLGNKAYIALSDSPEIIREKIKVAVTTPEGAKNLLELLGFFSSDKKLVAKFAKESAAGTIKFSELKPALAEAIIEVLKPIQEKQKYYLNNPKKVAKILADGAKQAQKIAAKNLEEIKKRMGLL